jgi:hypothetical protein
MEVLWTTTYFNFYSSASRNWGFLKLMTNRLVSFTTILLGHSLIASIVFCVLILSYYVVGVLSIWCLVWCIIIYLPHLSRLLLHPLNVSNYEAQKQSLNLHFLASLLWRLFCWLTMGWMNLFTWIFFLDYHIMLIRLMNFFGTNWKKLYFNMALTF